MRSSTKFSYAFFLIVIFGSIGVLAGWQMDIPSLKSVVPGLVSMKVNTALCLLILAVAGLAFLKPKSTGFLRILGLSLSVLTLVIALASACEYVFHFNLNIDEIWIEDTGGRGGLWPPGRPAPITLFNFIFISIAYLLELTRLEKWKRVQQGMMMTAWVLSFQALIGYSVGVTYSFGSAFYTQIAIHTALCFILITSAFMISKPDEGFMRILSRKSMSGNVGRTLLAWAIFIPPFINWIQLKGVGYGFWDADFGTLVRVIGNVVFFSWLALSISARLNRAEEAKLVAAQEATRESEKRQLSEGRLQLITNSVPALIAYVDRNERYQFANQTYLTWFGLDPAQVVGMTIQEVIGNSYAAVSVYVKSALAGEIIQFENSIQTPSGKSLIYEGHYIPDFSLTGQVRGFALIGHDITERIEVEKTLEHSIKGRDELLSICSHELKTPITTMKLAAQIFKRALSRGDAEMRSSEFLGRMVEQTDRQLNRLTRLVDEMLDFSLINGGLLKILSERVNLALLVDEVYADMEVQFEDLGVTVTFEKTGNTEVSCDRKRIEQVITNLFSNTLKYGEGKPVKVSIRGEKDRVLVFVQDFGMGISPEAQERIFAAYERAVSVYNISGLGLGLYISREIMRAHQGEIAVTSEMGKGTTFTVSLPKLASVS